MKIILTSLIILFLVADFSYSYSIAKEDTLILNADSIKSDYSFYKIELNKIDSTNLIQSDSLALGRFIKDNSPIINDWQFYLPYKDTVEIDLYDKDGNFIVNLLNEYLISGYYGLKVLPNKSPSNKYIIKFETSKDKIFRKFFLLH